MRLWLSKFGGDIIIWLAYSDPSGWNRIKVAAKTTNSTSEIISVEYFSQVLLLGYLNRITVTGFLDFPVTTQNSVSQEFKIAFAGGFDKFAIFIILETDYLSNLSVFIFLRMLCCKIADCQLGL